MFVVPAQRLGTGAPDSLGLPAPVPPAFSRPHHPVRRPGVPCRRVLAGEGLVDLAAFGVPFIANPDLPERMRRGWTLAQPKTDLFYGGGAAGYSDYPRFEGPA